MVHLFKFTCTGSVFQPVCVQDLTANNVLNMREFELKYVPQRNYEFPIWAVYLVRLGLELLEFVKKQDLIIPKMEVYGGTRKISVLKMINL